jgi:hypothetical protein
VLHFAELYWHAAGQRVFDVMAEGARVLDNYDIINKAGANFTAITETFTVNVADGKLDLVFSALESEGGVNRPKVSAIEVLPDTQVPGASQQVLSFTLMNASNNQEIRTLVSGETINLATLPTRELNIRANTNQVSVGSVEFTLTGAMSRYVTETGAPYSLYGDNNGTFYPWTPAIGNYTLVGSAYTGPDGSGTEGPLLHLNFQVIDHNPAAAARMALPAWESIPLSSVITAYPNPTTDGRLRVVLPQAVEGEIAYELTTITGISVAKGKLKHPGPGAILELNFSRQMSARGLYYLRLEGQRLKHQLRVVRH